MEHLLKLLLFGSHGVFAYLTVFAILVACGLGVPLPEDLSLIFGGFLAHQGSVVLAGMMAVGFLGILVGDSLIFFAGRRIGRPSADGHGFFARIVTPQKRAKVECLFARHGQKIVMLARFLPGVRAVTYFTAGSAGMSFGSFLFYDGLAASFSAPLFVLLGFRFGSQLEFVIRKMKQFELTVGALLVVMVVLSYALSRRRAASSSATTVLGCTESPEPRPEALGERSDFSTTRVGAFGQDALATGGSRVELSK